MSPSAQSTANKDTRATPFTHAAVYLVIVIFITVWSGGFPAIAQSGPQTAATDSPSSISAVDDIRTVRGAFASTSGASAEPGPPAAETSLAGAPSPQAIMRTFLATAYSLKGSTASGVVVRRGIIAADPRVLPLGSIVRLRAGRYSGIYSVMDTGGSIRGRRIDIYLPTFTEAKHFGKREVKIEVLRHGWDPEVNVAKAK
jgi:3D (Asp-Asp-Asp) domain-containing protein